MTREFGAAFGDAARVWVLDVYGAGEPPIPGVSGASVVEMAREQGFEQVGYAPDASRAAEEAAAEARPGDLVLTLGAGDVWKLGERVLEHLRRQAVVEERR